MNTKQRIARNWITTVFGTACMFVALGMFIADILPTVDIDFSYTAMVGTALFGWVFVMAKDSLIEGLFMGVFKVKEKE